ncbi:MAG: amidohydrolase family protein [Armatimonadetes bacterium]|nr:amidohydrolase family protein [Armatimonadota bacterium]MDE2205634.1 amidohydrolase family protein [Armatimonadota bacterium]
MPETRYSGRLVTTGLPVTVHCRNGRIHSVAEAAEEAADCWLAPGFIDLQVNGWAGWDFNGDSWGAHQADARGHAEIATGMAAAGVTTFAPTITTAPLHSMRERVAVIAANMDAHPDLAGATIGIHVEGPWISGEDGPRGAHPANCIRLPAWSDFEMLQDAAGGAIRLVTLAPELPGALPFIERLVESGISVAVGHTAASRADIRGAAAAGATVSTHLGNGAHAVLPRHPNYIWQQLADDRLTATIIADGRHLPAEVIQVIARVKARGRMALVSDVMSLAGMPAGLYANGVYEVQSDGGLNLAGTPYLAGAAQRLNTGLENLLRCTQMPLAEAIATVTETPARIIGANKRKGAVVPGYDADLTLFTLGGEGQLHIKAAIRAGEVAWSAPEGGDRAG